MEKGTEKKTKTGRGMNWRTVVIVLLALIVLAEGAFLLLNRRSGPAASGTEASAADQSGADDSGDGGTDADTAPDDGDVSGDASGSAATPDPNGGGQTGGTDAGGTAGTGGAAGGGSGTQAPIPTPAVVIPDENKGKPYAGAIGILQNYVKSPSVGTLGYLMGGEVCGDQMQRFVTSTLMMSGQSFEQLQTQMNTSLDLPQGATSLVVTGETPLTQEQLTNARNQLRQQEDQYRALGEAYAEYKSLNDTEWEQLGSSFGMSGPDFKKVVLDLGDSASAMASRLSGADITEGYTVTLQTNTGVAIQTAVYCIGGKWVTNAFFDTQIN